jgi:16S rRNA (uracil1498-N3)-methyltransferase
MQRYFVESRQFQDNEIVITDDDAHHIIRVMRMSEGAQVIVSDGHVRTVRAQIVELAGKEVRLAIVEELEQQAEADWQVSIAQGLPKGDKMELIVQKCTEIGAAAFVPFACERVIVQYDRKKEAKRLERWHKIAKEAAEQSHRNVIPVIAEPLSWKGLLESLCSYDLVLFCYERAGDEGHGVGLKDVLSEYKLQWEQASLLQPRILLIVGPEGGFSEREAQQVQDAGAKLVGLGKRILRAETAGMVGLSCILYESGEMGGV